MLYIFSNYFCYICSFMLWYCTFFFFILQVHRLEIKLVSLIQRSCLATTSRNVHSKTMSPYKTQNVWMNFNWWVFQANSTNLYLHKNNSELSFKWLNHLRYKKKHEFKCLSCLPKPSEEHLSLLKNRRWFCFCF